MQSNDIIFQVSEETAGIMQDISGQLFEETDAQLNYISQALNEAANQAVADHKRIEESVTGLAGKMEAFLIKQSDVSTALNQLVNETKNNYTTIKHSVDQLIVQQSNTAAALGNCQETCSKILSSVDILLENDKAALTTGEFQEKMNLVMACLDTVSKSVQTVIDQHNEICARQAALEKDVQYLKLPFYKRWFTKG